MNDGETPPQSNDPRNRISRRAWQRIKRTYVTADKFLWDATASIQAQRLDTSGVAAGIERGKAALEKARAVLIVAQWEFSKAGLSDEEYRICINSEIEGAANSLELSDAHRRSLTSEFFFPLDLPPELLTLRPVSPAQEPRTTESAVHVPEAQPARDPIAAERSSALIAFKATGLSQGIRITDEMVAKVARPGRWNTRTPVTWWKRNDKRCGQRQDKLIRAVLAREPSSIWPAK